MPDEAEKTQPYDEVDWSVTTFEGNRRRQHAEFRALSFREKLAAIEELGAIAKHFASGRTRGEPPMRRPGAGGVGSDGETDHG